MKINCLNVTVIHQGSLTNASAHDETGQLRADLTTGNPADVEKFISDCQQAAVTVNVEGYNEPEFFTTWTPDGLQYDFGAGSDPVQAALF
jgi:hypothetical protein